MGVIPIVNENDTISVSEIKFGDNDTLSAITAAMVHADYLFLMTDVDCLYDKNPRTHPDAQPIEVVEDIEGLQVDGLSHNPHAPALLTLSSIQCRLYFGNRRDVHQAHSSPPRHICRRYHHHNPVVQPRQHCKHCLLFATSKRPELALATRYAASNSQNQSGHRKRS